MKRAFFLTLVLAGSLSAVSLVHAQTPAGGDGAGPASNKTPDQREKPAAGQQQATPQSGANPFPEDTGTVPVMPSKGEAVVLEGTDTGTGIPLADDDSDPVRSPDDPLPANAQEGGSSSSSAGLDRFSPPPDDEESDKKEGKRKLVVKETAHQEGASEDINVGGYYLEKKNWKAAQSRFQSAMILDPENPEVYWGLAEAAHHLGNFAEARSYYEKVVDYDPDSKHGKDARKALKDPEIANAKATSPGQPAAETPK